MHTHVCFTRKNILRLQSGKKIGKCQGGEYFCKPLYTTSNIVTGALYISQPVVGCAHVHNIIYTRLVDKAGALSHEPSIG
jgi:hypothetical protein